MAAKGKLPLIVFVGASPDGQDSEAVAVLTHSLRRRASVDVEPRLLTTSQHPGWLVERWATPWTALRWAVPELCGARGRAIYFDCPTLVTADIEELAAVSFPDDAVLLARRDGRTVATACLVFDCARAVKLLPSIAEMKKDVGAHQTVGALLDRYAKSVGPLPNGWGMSDQEFSWRGGVVPHGSVHFSNPYTQPHIPLARARLAREGRKHWFEGMALPHYSPALVGMFEAERRDLLEEA